MDLENELSPSKPAKQKKEKKENEFYWFKFQTLRSKLEAQPIQAQPVLHSFRP